VVVSSARFKRDIRDMGEASSGLGRWSAADEAVRPMAVKF
jgi:hypothetical protein